MKIFQQYDGQPKKLYCEKDNMSQAKELLNFIKSQCEIIIGESEFGFYAKCHKEFSTPFTLQIEI